MGRYSPAKNLLLQKGVMPSGSFRRGQTPLRITPPRVSSTAQVRTQASLTSHRSIVGRFSPPRRLDNGRKVEPPKLPRGLRLETGFHSHGDGSSRNHSGFQVNLPSVSSLEDRKCDPSGCNPGRRQNVSQANSLSQTVRAGLVGTGRSDRQHPTNPRRCSLQSPLSCTKGQGQDPPHNRPISNEQVRSIPILQNGGFKEGHQRHSRSIMGSEIGHSGRLPVSFNLSKIPEVFCVLDRTQSLHVQKDALRSHHSSLGFHQINESCQEVPEKERCKSKFLHRRFPHLGTLEGKSCPSLGVDQKSLGVVRFPNKYQEDLHNSITTDHLSGRRSRPSKPDHEPSSCKSKPPSEPFILHNPEAVCVESRFGIPYWSGYFFLLGTPYWENVCNAADSVDEYTHFCPCQICSSACYSLSAGDVESFLHLQILKSQEVIQAPHPRFDGDDGCFRLWLEWCYPPLLCKGYLVCRGQIKTHQRERNASNSLLCSIHESLPGWKACGDPHRQRGSILLFKENGFPSFSSPNVPCSGVSISVSSTGYYFRGPSYSGQTKCACGLGLEGHPECNRELSGPGDLLIWFISGRLRLRSSGRLMCYLGEYEVQALCFPRSGPQSGMCGGRCHESRLVKLRSNLSFSSNDSFRRPSSQNREVPGTSLDNSSSYWPCIANFRVKGQDQNEAPGFLFSFPDTSQRSSSYKKYVLRLMDVGMVNIPLSLAQEPRTRAHTSPPSRSLPVSSPQVPHNLRASTALKASRSGSASIDLTSVLSSYYVGLGCEDSTLQILLREHGPRTFNQYSRVWQRFKQYLSVQEIPAGQVSEATVLNYLASRLKTPGVKGREQGKLAPQSIKTEYYGLISPMWVEYGVALDPTARSSISKKFFTAVSKIQSSREDLFPKWDLRLLLRYLQSDVYEPLSDKPLHRCREKAVILLMLATGRRLEDTQALSKTWQECTAQDGTPFIRFKFYDGWYGKAVKDDPWNPDDITLFAIDEGPDDPDLSTLCPLRAFRIFWQKRKDLGDLEFLWMNLHSGFLSRAVTRVISLSLVDPSSPVAALPDVGTHNLRKFAFSLAYIYFDGNNLQQLANRAGSRNIKVPMNHYIRNVRGPSFYVCTPLGTLKPGMPKVRPACDPKI